MGLDRHDFLPAASGLVIIVGMTTIAALSFCTLLVDHRAKARLQFAPFCRLGGTVCYYWP